MSECDQLARPVVRCRAGFHAGQTRFERPKIGDHAAPLRPPANDNASIGIDAADLEPMFGEIQTDGGNLHGGWPPLVVAFTDVLIDCFPSRSSMRPAHLWRERAAPTWLGRAPLHAAAISCCVLPVARARTWSPRFNEPRLPPTAFAVVVGGARAVARERPPSLLLHNSGQLLGSLLGPAVENRDGAAVGPTERGESLTERIEKPLVVLPKAGLDKADARNLGPGGARVRIDRPSRREQHDRAPFNSIAQAETVRLTAGQLFF